MPRTSASGDDTVVGQTVPSTIVDSSKAGEAGKQALIVKPARKFGIKGLALKRAPTYVFEKKNCIL